VNTELGEYEARVIGCLIEKEITTPEQYPLSLNALLNACNQKSNREPVLELEEADLQRTVDGLVKKSLVSAKTGFGSRVTKYQHRFCNNEFGGLKFTAQELGIICVLLLRGAQTPGELRTRTDRLCKFEDVHAVEAVLEHLARREDGPYVVRLAREPGKRESRYCQLFGGEVPAPEESAALHVAKAGEAGADSERLDHLERQVSELREEVAQLKALLEQFGVL
jgi:uncharacterized protein